MARIRSTARHEVLAWQRYAIPAEVEAALVNWARWAAPVRVAPVRVNAMFKHALRGHRWATAPGPVQADPVDVEGAQAVECTMCAPGFSPRFRVLLVLHYVRRRTRAAICEMAHLNPATFDAELQRAALYFWERHQACLNIPLTA